VAWQKVGASGGGPNPEVIKTLKKPASGQKNHDANEHLRDNFPDFSHTKGKPSFHPRRSVPTLKKAS